jgi:predicted nucleotidyltransferase
MTSIEVIEQIGQRLASAAPANSRVVLFGSHARGNADADADFDVLVIEPTVADAIQEAVRLRRELDELDVPIDLIVMDKAKAARGSPPCRHKPKNDKSFAPAGPLFIAGAGFEQNFPTAYRVVAVRALP